MREYVEIGQGREARRSFDLDQISLVPSRRTRSSKDVDTTWNIDAYSFDIPFMSHPTDALASPEFVIAMDKQGGLGVLNAEGLLARHADFEGAIEQVLNARGDWFMDEQNEATRLLQELHQAPLDQDLLAERVAQVRDAGATVAVRVSPQRCRELAPALIKAGVELLIVQGTIISAEHVEQGGEPLNLKEFIGSVDVPVIAGGVNDYTTALHLMRAGAVGVIVGGGFNTNDQTLGISTPLATAIADVAAARRDYLDETGGRYVHVIADGDLRYSSQAVKAIACGADAVVLGVPLSAAKEAAANGLYWPSAAAHPRFPRGEIIGGIAESNALEVILHGPSTSVYGEQNFVGALRRAMAKCGYTDLKKFQKVDLTVRL